MSMSTTRPLECVSQLQRQIEEEFNSVPPWQYAKMFDQFVDFRDITFGDHEVFHVDLARTE